MYKTFDKIFMIAVLLIVAITAWSLLSTSDAEGTYKDIPSTEQSSGYYMNPQSLMPKEESTPEPVSHEQWESSSSKAELLPPASSQADATIKPTAQPELKAEPKKSVTVYVTETGEKYHTGGCQYLRKSKVAISLDDAKISYSPCSKCSPPS